MPSTRIPGSTCLRRGHSVSLEEPEWPRGFRIRRSAFLLAMLLLPRMPQAQTGIDNTCATCSRRHLDSLNLMPRNIRVNQAGYTPGDTRKIAYVADPHVPSFSVVDAAMGQAAFTDGAMRVRGAYNSISTLYQWSRPARTEQLHRADFSPLRRPGSYYIVCGTDTSHAFAWTAGSTTSYSRPP